MTNGVQPAGEEQRLLASALRGSDAAWNALYARHGRLVSLAVARVLRRYLGSYSESDLADYTAEVWVALLTDDRRRLRLYDPGRCRLDTWLKLLATNCTIDQLRTGDRRCHTVEDIDERLAILADEQPGADEQLAVAQQAEIARGALRLLKNKDRSFVLCYLTDPRETKEIAADMGVSIHTVHSRKFKVRQKLIRAVRQLQRDRCLAARDAVARRCSGAAQPELA